MPFEDRMQTFINFPDVEAAFRTEVAQRVNQILLAGVRDEGRDPRDMVVDYLTHSQWEARLTTLIGLSGGSIERLKRVADVINPNQPWSSIGKDDNARQAIARFLVEPNAFGNQIPEFIRRCFYLRSGWPAILQDERQVTAIVINSLKSKYAVQCGLAQESRIIEVVRSVGLNYEKGKVAFVNNKEVDVAITNIQTPNLLIMSSISLTTASSQSSRANEQTLMYEDILRHNRRHPKNSPILIWNVIDGGGWINRKNDLEKILTHADGNFCNADIDDGTFRVALEAHKNRG